MLVATAAALAQTGSPGDGDGDAALRAYLSANGMLARGMNELAEEEYRRFLKEQPGHARAAHARYGLAVALYRQKKFDEAAAQARGLSGIEGFEFAAESAILEAQCALAGDRPGDAAVPLKGLLERHASHELADDAGALLAECEYRAGRYAEAIRAAGALAAAAPGSPLRDRAEYFAALGQIKSGDEKGAAARLAALAASWPDSALAGRALVLSAQCAHRAGDIVGAKRGYAALLGRKDSALMPEALVGLAAVEEGEKDLEGARGHLDRVLEEFPDSAPATGALLARARVLLAAGEAERARGDVARYARAKGADGAQAAYWTAKCDLKAGEAGRAARVLSSALEDLAGDHALRPAMMYDLAVALVESGSEDEAVGAFGRFCSEYPEDALAPDAAVALATLLHRAGKYGESEKVCEAFRAAHPKGPGLARIDLLTAENAFLSDDLAGAEKAYSAFLGAHAGDDGAALAGFRLGCVYFRRGEHAKASPLLEKAAGRAEKEEVYRPALLYLGDIAFQAGRWEEAEERLGRYAGFGAGTPGLDDALLKRGIALHNVGRDEAAADALGRVAREFAGTERAGLATLELARVLRGMGREEEASERLRALAEGKDGAAGALARNQLAAMAAARGDSEGAAELYRDAAESADEGAAAEALHGLGSVLLTRGDYSGAVRALDRLLEEHPGYSAAAEARAQLAIAAARAHADEGALAGLDEALRGEGTVGAELRDALRFERAACLRALKRDDEAGAALRTLAGSAATPGMRVRAALEAARAELEASRPAAAAEAIRSVASLLEEEGVEPGLREQAEYQLAAAEFRQEHFKEAGELFGRFAGAHPGSALFGSASLLAAESLIRQGRQGPAVAHLKAALGAELPEAERQSAMLRLGEALAAGQDWAGSERAFSEFLERFGSSELWFQARFGKGWALENQGRQAEAMAEYAIVTGKHQGPTAARAQFQIGECLFAQGKHDEAVRELLKVDILYAYPEWSAAALYEAGRCFEAMNQTEKARAQYEQVREKHGQTRWASLAAKRLTALAR